MNVRLHAALVAAMVSLTLGSGCTGEPELPTCETGQVPQQTATGWQCADLPAATEVNTLATSELNCAQNQIPIFADGAWRCGAATSASGGDIDAVVAGAGLSGGSDTGAATLAVNFAGTGSASTVARSDHGHAFTSLTGVPPGFLDLVDNDAVGSLACSMEQVPRYNSSRAAWECWTPPTPETFVELDPTVNALAKSTALNGCGSGQVAVRASTGNGWVCQTLADRDVLGSLSCGNDQIVRFDVALNAWKCATLPAPVAAITAVAAGPGLTTTTDAGVATVGVQFASVCASGRVACSDDLVVPPTPSLSTVLAVGANAGGTTITGLGAPAASTDAVTKGYVDALTGSGGASTSTLVLCCGNECVNRMPGFNCDTVAANGSLVVPLPDARGMLMVPETGNPRLLAAAISADGGNADVNLNTCSSGWQVCTQGGFSSVMVACGAFASSSSAEPWLCTAPPKAYIVVPGVKGIVYVDGTDAANEYLRENGQSNAPASVIDCSAAAPLPGPGTKTAVCFR